MWQKILIVLIVTMKVIGRTPLYNKAAVLTLEDCWQIQHNITYWQKVFAISITILAAILIGGIVWLVIYCRSKRNTQ